MPTVLIADDDEDLRPVVRMLLEDEGYEVVEAANGRDAYDLLCQRRSLIVLLDLHMPDHKVPLIERITQDAALQQRHEYLIFTGMKRGRLPAAAAAAWPQVTKPFDIDDFMVIIDAAKDRLLVPCLA